MFQFSGLLTTSYIHCGDRQRSFLAFVYGAQGKKNFIPVLSVTNIPCVLASQHNKAYPQFNIQQDWKNYIYKQFLQVIHHRRWARRCRRRWTRRSPLRGSHGHQSRLEGPPGGPLEFYCLLCLSSKEIQKQLKFVSVAVKVKRKEGGR